MRRTVRVLVLLVVSVVVLVACQPRLDVTPDAFSFGEVTGADLGAVVTSDAVTVTGIDTPVALEVSGVDAVALVNGAVVADGSGVSAGDEVQVRLTASDQFSTTVTATVTIGVVSAEFSVTTRDSAPDAFSVAPVADAELDTTYTSAVVSVSGVDVPVPVSLAGDASAVLVVGGVDTEDPAEVEAGDEVQVRVTSSAAYATAVSATVTIGGVGADFVVTTKEAPEAPVITSFSADPGSVAWGDEDVALSWTVTGDVDGLVLTNDYDAVVVDVTGLAGWTATVPSDVPSVTYTLTAANDELAVSDEAPLAIEVRLWVCAAPLDVVTIADPALEQALRDATAIPADGPITCAQMGALISFNSGHFLEDGGPNVLGEIASLVGLQHAVNLEVLNLQVNLIRDVTPLANLTELRELTLDLNPVEDLAPLANLTNLTLLSLWHMLERDLDAFPYATSSYPSALCGTDGLDDGDLANLAGLVNLTEFYVSYNAVTDLSPLASMDGLELVFMACNAVDSFAPLNGFANLAVLWASDNDVDDTGFAAAASWSALQWLRLDYNRVSDVAPLGSLENLYALGLEGNFLESVGALADNLDFPGPAGSLPVEPPVNPTLSIGFNCLDTSPDSAADQQVQAIVARGVTIGGFDEASQNTEAACTAFTPSVSRVLRLDTLDGPFGRSLR